MTKNKYEIYLREFEKRFIDINKSSQARELKVFVRVPDIIRMHIALHAFTSPQQLELQHARLVEMFQEENAERYMAELEGLRKWEAQRLEELFPELNRDVK